MKSQLQRFINSNISVNQETLDFITDSFFKYGSKKILVNKESGDVIELGGSREIVQQIITYSMFFGYDINEQEAKFIALSVIPMNVVTAVTVERNILSGKNDAFLRGKELVLVKGGLPEMTGEKLYFDDSFIKDFKKHFSFLDTLIDMIVLNHITPQKNSFLAIKAPSNAGKTLIMKALDNAGLAKEVNYQLLIEKQAVSPYSPDELNDSLSLIEDEFKYFTEPMKNLTFNTSIASKGQMARRVKIGLKVMLFANDSSSFNGGVDDQITNRVIYHDWKATPITYKEFYTSKGFTYAVEHLSSYIRVRAEKIIEDMIKMDSTSDIDTYVYTRFEKLSEEYGLDKRDTVINVDDSISEAIVSDIEENGNMHDIVRIDEDNVMIRKPLKTIRAMLTNQLDEGKVRHLMTRIESWIATNTIDHRAKPKRLFGKAHKGIIVSLSSLYNSFPIDGDVAEVAEVVNGTLIK